MTEAGNEDIEPQIIPDISHMMHHRPDKRNIQYRHLHELLDEQVLANNVEWLTSQKRGEE